MAFGIRNVPDRLKALREFRRIMAKPSPPTASGVAEEAGGKGEKEGSSLSSSPSASSVVAILELQDPELGFVASASRAFIK